MTTKIYQLRVELEGSVPKVWRSILVSPDIDLFELHQIIQTTMGWENKHHHRFGIGRRMYAPEELEVYDARDSRKMKLKNALKAEKDSMTYEYDFGDSWVHNVILVRILPKETVKKFPYCKKGKGGCPEEGIGGIMAHNKTIGDFYNFNDEYCTIERIGFEDDFRPELFNRREVNQYLQMNDYGCDKYDATRSNTQGLFTCLNCKFRNFCLSDLNDDDDDDEI